MLFDRAFHCTFQVLLKSFIYKKKQVISTGKNIPNKSKTLNIRILNQKYKWYLHFRFSVQQQNLHSNEPNIKNFSRKVHSRSSNTKK